MKIKNIQNAKDFFEKLKQCKGSIELITAEGDRLNLKSKLCQYIVMMDIFNSTEIGELEIVFSNTEDVALIFDYLIKG